eukprot:CAMPEP_0198424140 /NCGR_PEP_ID=MMETSP1452-20131203/3632_1 /TAXON_ID=1181717 /ORGANISM="Synchroma pusillum, Strain CCMP3072" /LENGTH=104 /DNA_ID=CAMNT_0044144465 /DNA_START=54 /DNA_END=368 /DNA_ORIENTATION=-
MGASLSGGYPSNDYELAIVLSKRLEAELAKLGAEGKGLHERVTAAGDRIPRDVQRRLRAVATVRNKLIHEQAYNRIDNRAAFIENYEAAMRALQADPQQSCSIS